jgi:hypothetical protein
MLNIPTLIGGTRAQHDTVSVTVVFCPIDCVKHAPFQQLASLNPGVGSVQSGDNHGNFRLGQFLKDL